MIWMMLNLFPEMSRQEALSYVFEDNETLIKMIMKGRSPAMRHVSRTHRVALEWLFEGNFTRDEWNHLLSLFNISHFSSTACSAAMAKRVQQNSGEERVRAKSRPMMSFFARVPSTLSSSASESPEKKSFESQSPWSAKAEKNDQPGQPVVDKFIIGNNETESELSMGFRSFLNRVNDQLRKNDLR